MKATPEYKSKEFEFNRWMKKVDGILMSFCGITSLDLADQGYWNMFADGATPAQAAREALEYEGFPF